jgi:hypothetical protein
METGTLLFVHGTGVRIRSYQQTLDVARSRAKACGVALPLVECQWGDALGIQFAGKSLTDDPDPAVARQREEAELQWSYLDTDPFFELRLIAADRSREVKPVFGQQSTPEKLWERGPDYGLILPVVIRDPGATVPSWYLERRPFELIDAFDKPTAPASIELIKGLSKGVSYFLSHVPTFADSSVTSPLEVDTDH